MKQNYFLGLKVLIITMLSVMHANAQGSLTTANTQFVPSVFMPTPQQASLAKVSEIPVDITTGRMDFKIPIYEIKEKGLSLPISLSYNYSGLLLEENAGWAGTGWTFNIGGSIVHSVNGLNDEYHEGDKHGVDAYLFNKPPFDGNHSEYPYIINEVSFLEGIAGATRDGLPDKYIINIGNINCTFYIDKDGNAIFTKNEPYKLSGTTTAGFTLTDDKGIKYKFDKMAMSHFDAPKNADLSVAEAATNYDYISSYLITEITFPDSNNTITFQYEDSNIYYQDFMLNQSLVLSYNTSAFTTIYKNPTLISTYNSYLKKIITSKETIEVSYNNSPTGLAVIDNLIIKENNNVVKNYDLDYSDWFGRRINLLGISYNGQMLNQMEYDMSTPYPIPGGPNIQNDNYLKKDLWGYYNSSYIPPTNSSYNPPNGSPVALEYTNSPYNNPTLKPNYNSTKIGALTKITYATKGYSVIDYEPNKVHMTRESYNLPYDPDIFTVGGDNAQTSPYQDLDNIDKIITITIPCKAVLTYDLSNNIGIPLDETYTNGTVKFYKEGSSSSPIFIKSQNWNDELQWIPSQLNFHGNEIITDLESGTYHLQASSIKGTKASISLVTNTLPEELDQTVGGLRIKQIKNCDFNGTCITDTYSYSASNNYSSGVSLTDIQFSAGSYHLDNMCTGVNATFNYYNYGSVYPLSPYRGSPVLYGVVTKTVKDDSGNAKGKEVFYSLTDYPVDNLNPEQAILRNGVLIKKNTIDQSNKLLEQTVNVYDYSVNPDVNKKVYGITTKLREDYFSTSGIGCIHTAHNHNSFLTFVISHSSNNYKIKTETTTQYFNNESLVNSSSYNYNESTGLTKSQSTINSKGEVLETKYYYPQDSEMSGEPFKNELVAANMIGIPLDTQSHNSGIKLSEQKTDYIKTADNLLLPKYIYANKGTAIIDKINDKKITFNQYDDKGNILQYTPESGTPVSIIWGYNKTQPIAKIENGTYDQIAGYVSNLQTLSNGDHDNCVSNECTEQIFRNALNTLRSSFPQSMVTTYTYNPLIGVTSVTDPKGNISYYEYDSFGRLKFVKDKDLNVLQKYCYNYKGQLTDCSDNSSTTVISYKSIARSGSFTKNNCTSGTASSVTYTQAQGAVISTISQADADANGLVKFNTDGQANANTNGTCTFSSIAKSGSFTKSNCTAGAGSSVTYTQAQGAVTSTISQADADANGLTKFNTDGQANANTNGTCIFSSVAQYGGFMKNNCTSGVGSLVDYSQAAGAVTSTISQSDADAKGLTKFNTDGQANANTNGICDTIPAKPTGLTFTSATATSLNFSWSAVVGATSYKIYKNGAATGITSATNTCSLSGLTASTAYSIQVMAVNASGNSVLSTAVSMSTIAAPVSNSCSLNFSRVSGTSTLYKNGSGYLTRSISGTSSGTLTTGDTFYVVVSATTTYYKGITITSSVRGILYNYAMSKTGSAVTSPTFTKTGSEVITIDCITDTML
ncbi:DUF5977 domain-containing protein [Flavobacterium salmonis]|uniref:Fibronectin type-III domain-containing protein n=1 Tax=Flavobacterium salmonis TaxID=2654844 RepID=A0A6V6YRP8_9FLAO|nr:DUF5977 domain-containing protein [Flavobacterium salmonis]CAD0002155.1 hypothetical protein FLAT13_00940 [Flavobacterium salmonis]